MPFAYPWAVASGFYIRGTLPTADELAWIRANRDYMLIHVQHLLPPESFLRLQRDGTLNLNRR
jgi:hypothetical protein